MKITILKTRTRFMKKMISKYISKAVSEALGCEASIWFNDMNVYMKHGRICCHIDMWAGVDRKEFTKAVKSSKD